MDATITATEARPAPTRRGWLARPLQFLGVLVVVVLIPVVFGMEWDKFLPLFRPLSLRFISVGVLATISVSVVAILVSLPLATALALGRLSGQPLVRWPCVAFVEVVRALPLLLLIFYINLRIPDLFANLRPQGSGSYDYLQDVLATVLSQNGLAVTVALIIYTSAVNAELLRSGILSLDRGQTDASRSLGLTYRQTMQRVILPQAFRRIVAPLIAQFTILLKDTSLGSIVGFIELQRRAQILFQRDFNPMEALYFVALIYFVLNYLLGLSSKFVERRRPSVEVKVAEMA
jgi:His/Glu/Gln/Arg/opine family amino acid ABC transporter permease subunit